MLLVACVNKNYKHCHFDDVATHHLFIVSNQFLIVNNIKLLQTAFIGRWPMQATAIFLNHTESLLSFDGIKIHSD